MSNERQSCAYCGAILPKSKPSARRKYCNHKCAFAVFGAKVRAASATPEARKKMADALRGRGAGKSYPKLNGRHAHRVVAERALGRALMPGEIVHHADENKLNYSSDNLEVLPSQAEHARLHHAGVKRTPKTLCKVGHALSGENIYITSTGRRRCLTCQRDYQARWKRDKRRARGLQKPGPKRREAQCAS